MADVTNTPAENRVAWAADCAVAGLIAELLKKNQGNSPAVLTGALGGYMRCANLCKKEGVTAYEMRATMLAMIDDWLKDIYPDYKGPN